jgi:hypothetical protein
MKAPKPNARKTGSELLERATKNLLVALKKDMVENDGAVDYDKLRKDGYSPRLLARLEEC